MTTHRYPWKKIGSAAWDSSFILNLAKEGHLNFCPLHAINIIWHINLAT